MRIRNLILIALIVLVAVPTLAQPRGRRMVVTQHGHGAARSPFELVVEAAAAQPFGDLGDDFVGTEKGLGAGTGFELGGRLRYHLGARTTVGPAIHYADFGDWDDVFDDGEDLVPYYIRTSVLRVGVDLQRFLADRAAEVRPYVTLGVAFYRNRYEDWVEGSGVFESTSNNLGLTAGAGLAMGPIELSGVWNFNPARNRELVASDSGQDDAFNWSYVVVRAGIAFGG